MQKNKRNNGFTLAEVLITLAVIGVIAALTIPLLSASVSKITYYENFKKQYALLSQAMNALVLENGDFTQANSAYGGGFKAFLSQLKIAKICPANTMQGECFTPQINKLDNSGTVAATATSFNGMVFTNGASIAINEHGGTNCTSSGGTLISIICGDIILDTTGPGPPNMIGRDIFYFKYTKDKLVPFGSSGVLEFGPPTWWYCNTTQVDPNAGKSCATRLLQEGQMKY